MFQKVVNAKSEAEKNKYFEDIQELITNVQFAYDEGDYGEWSVYIIDFPRLYHMIRLPTSPTYDSYFKH